MCSNVGFETFPYKGASQNRTRTLAYFLFRVQRTIFKILARYMKKHRSSRFVHILPRVVQNYNNTYHSAIKMPPSAVDDSTLGEATVNLYYSELDPVNSQEREPKYEIGQNVMVSRLKGQFKKGYSSNFSNEVYRIRDIDVGLPIRYMLSDICEKESDILGKFYEEEITPVQLPAILNISEVLSTEKRRGREFFEVKFVNKPQCEPEFVSLEYLKKGATDDTLKSRNITK